MTDLEICNLALSFFDKTVTQAELDANKTKEARACVLYLPIAKRRTIGEENWSFFTSLLDVDYDDSVEGYGYMYGYALPQNFSTVISVEPEGTGYRVLNGRIYTNETNPKVWGITEDCMDDIDHTEDFDVLVGFSLGFLISGNLAPSDVKLPQVILQQYAWTKGALLQKEARNLTHDGGTQERDTDKANLPEPKYVLTDEGQYILQ